MIRNNIKIAWRNIVRNRTYTAINVLGLALGLCACIVIYVIVSYEFSFDAFHPGKDHIYRFMGDVTESTGEKLHFGKLPMPVSQAVRTEIPGVDFVAGLSQYNAKVSIPGEKKPAKGFDGSGTVIAEQQYFSIFKYDWLAGNSATALQAPFAVVVTESKARQYFGNLSPNEIIGKEVIYNDSLRVTVTGIIADWKKNTDLSYTDFISFSSLKSSFLKKSFNTDSWTEGDMTTWCFVKLSPATLPAQLAGGMAGLVKRHADPKMKMAPWLEPLSDIHFNADVVENGVRTAHKPTLLGLVAIALFILILAVINFVNLATAQSIRRAREVGVRKVLGSSRWGLVFQFLTETLVLTVLAVGLAVLLVNPVLNAFHSFIPPGVSFHLLNFSTCTFLLIITLSTSLLAGLYPAKVLSTYLPAKSLKGEGSQRGGEKWLLRKGLIVFQFSVSLIFIIGAIVINNQLRFTRSQNLGFTADAIVTVGTPFGDSLSKIKVLAEKVKQIPGVSKVGLEWVPPMTENGRGMRLKFKSTDLKETGVTQVAGNEDIIPLYQIKLLAGRNLVHSDSAREFVINESLSKLMGCKNPADAVGKMLYWNNKLYPVVGVAADFHSSSFHDPITPLCIVNRPEREGNLAVKLATIGKQSNAIKATLSQMEKAWKQVYPAATFNYQFYDESLALLYQKDQQTGNLTDTAMVVTIFISCIGLFGLALFTAEKRAKEISIRKILGASVANIATMLSKDFVILVVIALFIASPVAWYFMNAWLQGFAYRIDISVWIFIAAGAAAISVALITISFQAIKAALMNPVKSLKME